MPRKPKLPPMTDQEMDSMEEEVDSWEVIDLEEDTKHICVFIYYLMKISS